MMNQRPQPAAPEQYHRAMRRLQIIQDRSRGLEIKDIADKHGVSGNRVVQICRAAGMPV